MLIISSALEDASSAAPVLSAPAQAAVKQVFAQEQAVTTNVTEASTFIPT